jgi:hypothetical protein
MMFASVTPQPPASDQMNQPASLHSKDRWKRVEYLLRRDHKAYQNLFSSTLLVIWIGGAVGLGSMMGLLIFLTYEDTLHGSSPANGVIMVVSGVWLPLPSMIWLSAVIGLAVAGWDSQRSRRLRRICTFVIIACLLASSFPFPSCCIPASLSLKNCKFCYAAAYLKR